MTEVTTIRSVYSCAVFWLKSFQKVSSQHTAVSNVAVLHCSISLKGPASQVAWPGKNPETFACPNTIKLRTRDLHVVAHFSVGVKSDSLPAELSSTLDAPVAECSP